MFESVAQSSRISDGEDDNQKLRAKLDEIRHRRRRLQELRHRQGRLLMEQALENNRATKDQDTALIDFRSALMMNRTNLEILESFTQWNALNDCFLISYSGSFGTINGLRLGLEAFPLEHPVDPIVTEPSGGTSTETRRYLPSGSPSRRTTIQVPWTEINAALGQIALLLSTLAKFRHCGIQYRHQILPQGSTSKIGIRRAGGAVSTYNLYHDDSFQLFGRRNFNIAMECLCECVMDAAEALRGRDRTMVLPYALERVRGELMVGRLSIAIAFGQDGTEWTRAMKYLLTDLKYIMTFRLFRSSNAINS